jgi:hypothetical protein
MGVHQGHKRGDAEGKMALHGGAILGLFANASQ